MPQKTIKIIGINPGTRYLGIAILFGPELMDWRIKVLEGKWSEEKINKAKGIVSELINQYEPNILAIKRLHPSRRSENLLRLVNKIKEYSKQNKLKLYQYSIKEIEKLLIRDVKLNKRNLIDAMVELYPVLHHDLGRERNHRNPYYFRSFEAVALASACPQESSKS
jgi:Holliday junction resolvasome RuvABC endonuclease subunit